MKNIHPIYNIKVCVNLLKMVFNFVMAIDGTFLHD